MTWLFRFLLFARETFVDVCFQKAKEHYRYPTRFADTPLEIVLFQETNFEYTCLNQNFHTKLHSGQWVKSISTIKYILCQK